MEIGTLKAFEVAKRYDNSRGVTFSSYLAYRIIGHFLDICHPDRRRPEKIQMFSIDAVAQMGLESFYLEDPSSLDEQDLIDLYESLFQIWRRLTPRETQVLDIMLRNEGITLQAVADQLGLTESRISQLRQSIYTKYKELIQ